MQRMVLDSAANGAFLVLSVQPRADQNGEQRTDRDGLPQWDLECLHRPAQENASAEVVKVRIAGARAPVLELMTEVRFAGFEAFYWTMNDRSGIALSCAEVAPLRNPKAEG